jgi:hypothetical protein
MMKTYRIVVMLPDVERRKKTLGPLHFLAACMFFFYAASILRGLHSTSIAYWTAMLLIGAWLVLFAFLGKRLFASEKDYGSTSQGTRWVESGLFMAMALFAFYQGAAAIHGVVLVFWSLAFAFMAWTERTLFEPITVSISAKGVGVPRPGGVHWYSWSQIEGIILRPDYFTVLFPGNRHIQYEVSQFMRDTEIMEINEFCSSMLKQNTPT